jgi:hypothetical protein
VAEKIIWPEERTTSTNVATNQSTNPPIHQSINPPIHRLILKSPRFQSYSNLIKDKTRLKFHSQTPKLSTH